MSPIAVSAPTDAIEALKEAVSKVTVSEVSETPDLRSYAHFDATPSIGTEFRTISSDGQPILKIEDVLADQNKLKALGRLVSERGVVFFRDTVITPEQQKTLVDALGRHGGKPASSGLHIHPLTLPNQKEGDEITIISNKFVFGDKFKYNLNSILDRRVGKEHWVGCIPSLD